VYNPRSERFCRTKEQLIQQAYEFAVSDHHFAVKYAVIHDILWHWTEYDGKYGGNQHWSKKAVDAWQSGIRKDFYIEDHVVPRKYFIDFLIRKTPVEISEHSVKEIFQKHLVSCVITKEEDKRLRELKISQRMPDEFDDPNHLDKGNTWIRYEKADIVPLGVAWDEAKKNIIATYKMDFE